MGTAQSQSRQPSQEEQRLADFIDETILAHDVVVFGKILCGATLDAKVFIEKAGKEVVGFTKPFSVDIDRRPRDGRILQKVLVKRTGNTTSPWVFIGAQFRGGDRDLYMYFAGNTLAPLIEAAPEHRRVRGQALKEARAKQATSQPKPKQTQL